MSIFTMGQRDGETDYRLFGRTAPPRHSDPEYARGYASAQDRMQAQRPLEAAAVISALATALDAALGEIERPAPTWGKSEALLAQCRKARGLAERWIKERA